MRPLVNTGDGGGATCSGSVALIAMPGPAPLEAYYLPRQHSNNLIHDNEVASLWVMRASLPMLLCSCFICPTHFISRRSHLVLLIYGAPSLATSLDPPSPSPQPPGSVCIPSPAHLNLYAKFTLVLLFCKLLSSAAEQPCSVESNAVQHNTTP